VTVSSAAEVGRDRNAMFANPLFLPVVFANPAKFLAETFVKPVTANRNVVVATAGFANPVRVTGAVGTLGGSRRVRRS